MENKGKTKLFIIIAALFVVASFIFMFGRTAFTGSSIRKTDSTVMPEATGTTEAINDGYVVKQTYVNTTETISNIGIVFYRVTLLENVDLVIELLDGDKTLVRKVIPASEVSSEHRTFIDPDSVLSGMKDKELTLKIYSKDDSDTGLTVMVNNKAKSTYSFNGKNEKGTLCFSVNE